MNSTTQPLIDHAEDRRPGRAPWHLAVALLVTAGAGLAGCNTTEGAGEDIQEAGSAIEDAAD